MTIITAKRDIEWMRMEDGRKLSQSLSVVFVAGRGSSFEFRNYTYSVIGKYELINYN